MARRKSIYEKREDAGQLAIEVPPESSDPFGDPDQEVVASMDAQAWYEDGVEQECLRHLIRRPSPRGYIEFCCQGYVPKTVHAPATSQSTRAYAIERIVDLGERGCRPCLDRSEDAVPLKRWRGKLVLPSRMSKRLGRTRRESL